MDCRSFKKKHPSFLDDTLSGIETTAMRDHLRLCAGCARQDASIRRSLFLLRNLPRVEVSDGFSERLRSRLAVEATRPEYTDSFARGPSLRAFAGLAGALLMVGLLSLAATSESEQVATAHPRLPSVVVQEVASMAVLDTGDAAPAFVASLSMGMPVWPTLLLTEQSSLRFATTELRNASLLSPQH